MIGRHTVLTAAHCVDSDGAESFTFSLSCDQDVGPTHQPVGVKQAWSNPDFSRNAKSAAHDVGATGRGDDRHVRRSLFRLRLGSRRFPRYRPTGGTSAR